MRRASGASATWDAVIVGAGPNGLAAALALARAGRRVLVLEREPVPGGGLRSQASVFPGLRHDHCATVFALAAASPFFNELGIHSALPWVESPAVLAHPLDSGDVALLWRDLQQTAVELGPDGRRYAELLGPLLAEGPALLATLLGPLPGIFRYPGYRLPVTASLRFAHVGTGPVTSLCRSFRTERARALVAGLAAHSTLPLERAPSAAFALVLALCAHLTGWPMVQGGAVELARWLVEQLEAAGGTIRCSCPVERLDDLPPARAIVLDLVPHAALALARSRWPGWYRSQLERYRPGPGVFKVDWLVRDGVPWRDERCQLAATVHIGGSWEEIAAAERTVAQGTMPDRPFVILVQASRFDASRARDGIEPVWGYCHVPAGWIGDATTAIEAQIERFAPGFRERIVARRCWRPLDLERANPNLLGGDLTGGWPTLTQLFTRPAVWPWPPYRTPDPAIFLASAATPPGGGVHGMCGYWASRSVERWLRQFGPSSQASLASPGRDRLAGEEQVAGPRRRQRGRVDVTTLAP
ncbi:NAD(P)/FAD-dependent oxidoreductase [Thermomicrobium sp. 4228-Ro]|uniref:phytoene desaturase family protein n=1 Tax=Thermomicrobium sp. 4228-Ro TaxID=2993937 RepID=UPI002248A002|nr:NAD(P)/FAD-dependent oxidoreductase [Thermomicrobium sp. 4228-Ro]MCX2726360.1 NAD(P)/FAD-dependent oxidoreductase [Thermomicrobium sp. 4228-Ro]